MTKTRERPQTLPKSLKPERLTTMPLTCRLWWHQWFFEPVNEARYWKQRKTCMKCGRTTEVWV